jgi:hypothetical protein
MSAIFVVGPLPRGSDFVIQMVQDMSSSSVTFLFRDPKQPSVAR